MCGILGVRRSWQPDRALSLRALAALGWRGLDEQVLVDTGDWYLGVARLAISGPAESQPARCATTGRVAVFNGAVTSAAREWREAGVAGHGRNDAELALRRLARGGPRALTATCGPYALAILEPDSDVLWLARDPEGEKPLYVVTLGTRVVAFASAPAALRPLGIEVRYTAEDTARFLRYGFALPPRCADPRYELHADLRGAYEARPGAALRPVAGAEAPPEALAQHGFAARVRAAVARCAQAEVPVGLALSGGVDSSCLAAALHLHGVHVPAYQFRARGAAGEERARAAAVAAATGHALRPVDGGPELLQALAHLTRCTGLPQGDPSVLAAHALARAARADGVRVLLCGEGADDLWLGYRRHRAAALLPARGCAALPVPALANGTAARAVRALAAPAPYDALLEVTPPGFLREVLAPEVQDGALPGAQDGAPALARARRADRDFYLRFDLLPKCDTALMAAGVEGRCPYLDPELLAAPETRGGDARALLGKRALKDAFREHLPAGVLDRKKLGFGLPLERWFRESDLLADLLRDLRTVTRPHVRARGLARMVDLQRRGRARLGHALYLIAAHELWLRWLEEAA
jgi:asparagine synthase (glutamine-hydrolysing)